MRQPRPRGSTYLSIKQRETKEPEDKEALYRHLITIYTTEGFRWNGQPTNIPTLSQILNIPQEHIMGLVSQTGTNLGSLASPENIKNTLESIITLSTSFALEDRGLIMQQLNLLLTSQDGKYKPFVTGEVNKALKLALESNKNISELYKTFFTTQSSTTNILIQGANKEANEDLLTPDKALTILHEDPRLLSLPSSPAKTLPANSDLSSLADTAPLADELYREYGVGDFEDVRERRSGTDSLRAPEPGSRTDSEPAEGPPGLPAEEDGGFKRRGIVVQDVDIEPEG